MLVYTITSVYKFSKISLPSSIFFPWYLQGLFALVRASLPTIVIVSFTLMTLMSDSGVMLLQEIRSKLFTLMGERAKIVVQALVFLRVDSAIL